MSNKEAGYNYLPTGFTGTYTPTLSGDNSLFHAINRNKESFVADLKNPDDLEKIKKLITKADIITQNFRPGVIERIGLDYEKVKKINPKIVYGSITGYGDKGPWKSLPGHL